mmetsp:Transcript_31168/g.71989  ORF Transcript_31168/g.71989 Transcript_31168/m.71989 type:complete len:115 (-) Transcript_31168:1878-2222(-)
MYNLNSIERINACISNLLQLQKEHAFKAHSHSTPSNAAFHATPASESPLPPTFCRSCSFGADSKRKLQSAVLTFLVNLWIQEAAALQKFCRRRTKGGIQNQRSDEKLSKFQLIR